MSPRNPYTDPQPGDVLAHPDASRHTVLDNDYDGGVLFNTGLWARWDDVATWAPAPVSSDGGSDAPPSPDDMLDVVERHARTLTALLTAAQLAASSDTPTWARGPAEAWLRGQFEALGGGLPPGPRDPRTDPQPGDTKTWTDAYGHTIVLKVTAVDTDSLYPLAVEETSSEHPAGHVVFDDLTLEDWAVRYLTYAVWACAPAVGGAS